MNVLCVPRSVVSCALTSHLDTSVNASVVSSSPKTIALVSVGTWPFMAAYVRVVKIDE